MSQQDAEHAVLDLAALRMRLAPLRLELLALPAPAISALRSAGLRRIGEVLDLPASALAQRFGPATSEYLRRLCGEAPDPMPAVPFPGHYAGRVEFDGDLTDSVALLFPLQRLLWELQGYLRAADRALQTYTLRLEHHRHEDTELIMRCQVPSRDAAQLLTLARERLGVLALPAAVRALQLIAREFTAPAVAQRDFFARDNEHAAALHQTLDRVRARLGAHAVERMQLTPDYRPERAWRGDSAVLAEASATTRFDKANPVERLKTGHGAGLDTTELSPRPCWLLREPRALSAPPMLINGPERIESGWWDHADIARDYYLARADDGTRQWVFQDLRSGAWYLHGLWA
jgi:protein ImuB